MNLNKKNSFKNQQTELNVGNMKSKIEKTLNKQNSSVFGAQELKDIKKMNNQDTGKYIKEIGKDLKIKSDKLILPNFLCNIVEEPVVDPENPELSDGNSRENIFFLIFFLFLEHFFIFLIFYLFITSISCNPFIPFIN